MAKWLNGQIAKLSKKINLTIKQFNNIAILDISRTYLSHIFWPRIIGFLLAILATIPAVLNLHGLLFPEHEQLSKLNRTVLARPFSPQPHQALGQYYLDQGYLRLAKHELTLATQLGSLNAARLYDDTQQRKEKIKQEIAFLEKELTDKPGYRDAYVKLASLYWQLQDTQKAGQYMELAKQIDPNYPPLHELEKTVK